MKRFVLAVTVSALFATLSFAQGLGGFVGSVTDPSGAAVPAAKVTVTEEGTGLSRFTMTGQEGYYVIPSLRPAVYNLAVESSGFRNYSQTGVTLGADQTATVNVILQLGATTDTITVSAQSSQVDTATATMRQVVDDRRIIELPLNGRNAATLTLLVAGATSTPNTGMDQGQTKTFPGAVTIATNGSRANQMSYRLDGGNNTDEYTNVNAPFPFPDALQEFSVQTSNYSAEYGQNAGGVINIITKSGANEVHGDAFGFLRNAVFNARNFFAAQTDQLKRGQFGGTLGGPLHIPGVYKGRDRTFFFFGIQGSTIRNLQGGLSAFVPTLANQAGDFSALLSASNPNNPLKKATTILDPLNGQAFAGNLIPLSRLDPAALKTEKFLPQSGNDGSVFYSRPVHQNFNEQVLKIDHSLGQSDRLTGRYFRTAFSDLGASIPGNLLAYQDRVSMLSQNFLLQETHLFGPTLLNDLHLNYAREASVRGPVAGAPNMRDLGVNIALPEHGGVESLALSGFFTAGDNLQARFVRNNYTLADDVRWVTGRHNIAFGVQAELSRVDIENEHFQSGQFTFTSDVTNYAPASFMLGYVRTFRVGAGEFKNSRNQFYGIYAQDSVRLSSRLTLNFGLRWEPASPWKEIRGRLEVFSPAAYYAGTKSQVYSNAPAGLFFPGDANIPRYGLNASYKNFGPRAGLAYSLTPDGKTSLRAGGGVFYDTRQPGIWFNNQVDLTPYSPQILTTPGPGPYNNPLGGLASPFPMVFPPPKNAAFPTPVTAISPDSSGVFKTPVSYNWNVALERQIGADWLARMAYVGSHASHLIVAIELNPSVYTPGSKLTTDQRRSFQPYGNITNGSFSGNSYYNSFQMTLEKRFSYGFTVLTNYTWAKSMDNVPFAAGNSINPAAGGSYVYPWYSHNANFMDIGATEFDIRQRLVTSYVWQLPAPAKARKFVRAVVGGWQLSGLLQAQTGLPLTVIAGKDQSQTALNRDRAVLVGSPYGTGGCQNTAPCVDYLNPASFALPATGDFGNVGKSLLRSPGQFSWDMGLSKSFSLRERFKVQFRAEYFNVFNRVNFNAPGATSTTATNQTNTVSAAGFGSIRGAGDPRIGQLALKVIF